MVLFPSAALVWGLLLWAGDAYQQPRERMVSDQIEARNVRNPAVLRAMRATPRHLFVPESMRSMAYLDQPLPIGSGQTISQPYIVALMTDLLQPDKSHKVLEIGTGSGYQAAVLSPLVKQVCSIEIVPELARVSAALLKKLGYNNVIVRQGDGYAGWPEEAPFDRIILTAAPEKVPQALLDQLKPGGKLVAPVGKTSFTQELVLMEKGRDGRIRERSVLPVRFVPMVRGRR
ncbi:MAG: protein-L-isoaspartate(D-aspartate) O-methyltransferase [Acidobacteriales bacterium]|nr:MAG: protein-L-isoaspartate(D-aspartate) O-methyltransferase [Terriglobales bacterium]